MRIARALALAGIASRRKCEEHILNGAVSVNGEVILDLGRQVDPEEDMIAFRGRALEFTRSIYYMINKPEGYITTADTNATKTVYDLLPPNLVSGTHQTHASSKRVRVFPIGRLDRDSAGLLLFTNDGNMANKMMHPRYGVGKWYEVRLNRPFEEKDRPRLLRGVRLKDGFAKPEKFQTRSRRIVNLLIMEGRNREVRRIFEQLGYAVVRLIRYAVGPIKLGTLPQGMGRYLTKTEIESLKKDSAPKPRKTPSRKSTASKPKSRKSATRSARSTRPKRKTRPKKKSR